MRFLTITAMLTLSTVFWAVDKVQLQMKTGLWEVATTPTTDSELPLPAELLEKLTPEQRARLEERVKARSADQTTVRKRCVTSEQSRTGVPFLPYRSCTRTSINSVGGRIVLGFECADQRLKRKGTLRIQVLKTMSVRGEWNLRLGGQDRAPDLSYTFTANWRSSHCNVQEQ
jgi:Protein of unknown function (DUF3617)